MALITENRKFKKFKTREAWLEERSFTPGASTLAHIRVNGCEPGPIPNVPAIRSAIRFGSDWEPYVLQSFGRNRGMKLVKDRPYEKLEPGELSWYDNNLVTDGRMHVSYDGIMRNADGLWVTVEVKTGSKTSFRFLSSEQRAVYAAQAGIEAGFIGADMALIVYAQRPSDWESMSVEDISSAIEESIDVVTTPVIPMAEIKRIGFEDRKIDSLMAMLLATRNEEKALEEKIAAHIRRVGHPASSNGYRVSWAASSRTTTDYKRMMADYAIDNVEAYQKTVEGKPRLSIAKAK